MMLKYNKQQTNMTSNQKRVTIFMNATGSNSQYNGKVFALPESIDILIENVRKKFHLAEEDSSKIQLYTANGGQIDDVDLIRDDEILYAYTNSHQRKQTRQIDHNSQWIKLNIGGEVFSTTRSTIIGKEPGSMLAKMFAERDQWNSAANQCIVPSLTDDQGAYMIDRSPEYFKPLMGYLRHGQLIIDKHLNAMGVLEEAKFYGFHSVIPELETIVLQESLLANTIERSIGLAPLTRRDVLKALIQTSTETRLRFQGVNLSGADLSRLDLSNINFKYAILRGANLQGTTLNNCCLERADMSKCNLEGASLINCYMVCCNLEGSILRGSNMDSQTITEMTNLEGANLNNVNLEGSKMNHVNLRVASLKNANVQNCNLDYACLAGANLENSDLSGSDLNEVNLRGANLKGTRFDLIHTPLHMFYLTT